MPKNIRAIKKERRAPRRWIWDGMIKEGSINILVAQQSRGKSMLAIGLVKELLKARGGQTYLGRGVHGCKVLYISTEMPEDTIVERLSHLGVDGRMRNINKRLFVYYNPMPKLTDIETAIQECNPDFVILDILGGLIAAEGFEVNSYDSLNTVVPQLKRFGKTFLLIHHMNKQNRSMGSVATLSAMDTRMEMLETDRDLDDEGNVAIYQSVHVYGKDVQDKYVNVVFKYPTFELADTEEVEELDKPLSKLMQAVIMAKLNSKDGDSGVIEGTYQEVAAQCQLLEKYQFNPKRLGLLLKMNADTLKNNDIYCEIKRKTNGYYLKIWYDPDAAENSEGEADEGHN
jgi:hypothetical protein